MMPLTVEWALGIALLLLGIGLAMFYNLDGKIQLVTKEFAAYRENVALTFVRVNGLDSLRAELTGSIALLRAEVKADAEKSANRAEAQTKELSAKLEEIRDSMSRISGQKHTRAGET